MPRIDEEQCYTQTQPQLETGHHWLNKEHINNFIDICLLNMYIM